MSEVDLPIFTGLELVEGLEERESALGICLGADRTSLLDLTDGGLEAPRVEQGFQEREKGFGAYGSELWMAVITSVVWPEGRIRRLSLKIHPLGDVIPPSLRRAVCSSGS
jgi:hypothetical protein